MSISIVFSVSRTLLSKRSISLWTRQSKNNISSLLGTANKNFTRSRLVGIMSGTGVLLSVAFGSSQLKTLKAASVSASTDVKEKISISETIKVADQLYNANKMKEGLVYLEKHSDSTEAEILWRLARFCYKVGKYHTAVKLESEILAERAVLYAERALEADEENFSCHKWMGIIISWSSEFQGTRRKIERSYDIRNHFQRAIDLNPQDPTSRHLLGQWCYAICDVPWYQRKIASVVFATPPRSTYEEALSHFQAAEKVEPGFYSTNWLYIGKCYLQLGRVHEGGEWLKKVAAHPSNVEEDLVARREAEQLIKKLGIK